MLYPQDKDVVKKMGKRPASCYRYVKGPAYTRVKKYIRGVPDSRIRAFDAGNRKGEFPVHIHLIAEERGQIRHNALEAARMGVNRILQRKIGTPNYHLTIRVHPHHILRENKMMAVAGADRIQDGMRLSFGKATDRAARVKQGQELLTVRTTAKHYNSTLDALTRAKHRFSTPTSFKIGKGEGEVKKYLQKKQEESA